MQSKWGHSVSTVTVQAKQVTQLSSLSGKVAFTWRMNDVIGIRVRYANITIDGVTYPANTLGTVWLLKSSVLGSCIREEFQLALSTDSTSQISIASSDVIAWNTFCGDGFNHSSQATPHSVNRMLYFHKAQPIDGFDWSFTPINNIYSPGQSYTIEFVIEFFLEN